MPVPPPPPFPPARRRRHSVGGAPPETEAFRAILRHALGDALREEFEPLREALLDGLKKAVREELRQTAPTATWKPDESRIGLSPPRADGHDGGWRSEEVLRRPADDQVVRFQSPRGGIEELLNEGVLPAAPRGHGIRAMTLRPNKNSELMKRLRDQEEAEGQTLPFRLARRHSKKVNARSAVKPVDAPAMTVTAADEASPTAKGDRADLSRTPSTGSCGQGTRTLAVPGAAPSHLPPAMKARMRAMQQQQQQQPETKQGGDEEGRGASEVSSPWGSHQEPPEPPHVSPPPLSPSSAETKDADNNEPHPLAPEDSRGVSPEEDIISGKIAIEMPKRGQRRQALARSGSGTGFGGQNDGADSPSSMHNNGVGQRPSNGLQKGRHSVRRASSIEKAVGLSPQQEQKDVVDVSQMSRMHRMADHVLGSVAFEFLSIGMIFVSAAHIGLQTDWMARNVSSQAPSAYHVMDLIFCVFFSLELALRMFVHRSRFFTMWGWGWNIFDLILVCSQIMEEMVLLMAASGDGQMPGWSSGFLLRIVRVMRTVRVVRVMHVMRFAQELRLLVSCVLSSVKAFCWSVALILLLIYVVSIFLTQMVITHRVDSAEAAGEAASATAGCGDGTALDEANLARWYGSVPRAVLSLFQGLTGGLDWNDLVEPMITQISPWLGLFFFMYTAFAILAVMNVVTATFVENAIERAEQVKDTQKLNQASRLFKSFDLDSSGYVTMEEILSELESSEVHEFFQSIDVDESDAKSLFELLDADGSGSIAFEEFLSGCMRLQGPAKCLDLVLASTEIRRSFEHLAVVMKSILQVVMENRTGVRMLSKPKPTELS